MKKAVARYNAAPCCTDILVDVSDFFYCVSHVKLNRLQQ